MYNISLKRALRYLYNINYIEKYFFLLLFQPGWAELCIVFIFIRYCHERANCLKFYHDKFKVIKVLLLFIWTKNNLCLRWFREALKKAVLLGLGLGLGFLINYFLKILDHWVFRLDRHKTARNGTKRHETAQNSTKRHKTAQNRFFSAPVDFNFLIIFRRK